MEKGVYTYTVGFTGQEFECQIQDENININININLQFFLIAFLTLYS